MSTLQQPVMSVATEISRSVPPLTRWERLSFETMRAVLYVLARVLSLGGLYHVGRAFATCEWLINYKRRGRVHRAVAFVLGPDNSLPRRWHAGWRHFVRVRTDKMMYLIMDLLPAERLLKRLTVTNRHLLDESLRRGRGMYMALSHLGSHHLVISILMELGYEKIAGVRAGQMGAEWRFVQNKREQRGRSQVEYFVSGSFPRGIFRRLQDNYLVGSLIDVQGPRGEHLKTVEADIFGVRQRFLTGPLQIALRCRSPVVQTFVVSQPYFRYEVAFEGPLVDPEIEDESPDVLQKAVERYAANVERFARRYPCHISRV